MAAKSFCRLVIVKRNNYDADTNTDFQLQPDNFLVAKPQFMFM